MQLQMRTFSAIVSASAAAVQGSASRFLDLSVGSVLRALLEANAGVALWLQWLTLLVLRTTRAATSTGADLDSWMGDFGLARLPAVPASGMVTFQRFTPTLAASVPIGLNVLSSDGSQAFTVVADATNPAFSASQAAFLLPAGIASVTVAATAVVPGAAGNVVTGAVSQIAAAVPGVDTVVNAAAFQGGIDAESDSALRGRFANFLSSRSRATSVAIAYAIQGVQQGLQYTLQENVAPDGSTRAGCFVVTLDDGSGNPPASLLSTAYAAIDAVRPVGSAFTVRPPSVVSATITVSVATAPGANHGTVCAAVGAALSSYVNTLPIGTTLAWSRLTQLAYDASASVVNVLAVQLNGGANDLVPPAGGVIKAASVVVS